MATSTPEQTFANHTKLDPIFHLFAVPVFALMFISTIVHAIRNPSYWHYWLIVPAFAAVAVLVRLRQYATKLQDRVIRLEERLRLTALATPTLQERILELSESQLVALRFACDQEVTALAEKALNEKLGPKLIKQSIRVWRPDYFRV